MRRHPAEVTSDRLAEHYEQYYDRMSGSERDALSRVRQSLERIAEEDRARHGWAVDHPGIGVLQYANEEAARVAAGTAGTVLPPA